MVKVTDSHSGDVKFIRGRGKKRELPLEAFEIPPTNAYDGRIDKLISSLETKKAKEDKKLNKKAAQKEKRKSKKAAAKARQKKIREKKLNGQA